MGRERSLAGICLNEYDRAVLKSLLTSVGARTNDGWHYVDGNDGDVLIIDLDRPDGRMAWQKVANSSPRIAFTGADDTNGVQYRLSKPLRARDLIDVLNRVCSLSDHDPLSATTAPAPTSTATAVTTASAPLPRSFSPAQDDKVLFQLLMERQDGAAHIRHEGIQLTIDFSNRLYLSDRPLKELLPLCSKPLAELAIGSNQEPLSDEPGVKPLAQLLWFSTLVGSKGKILPELAQAEGFKLQRWPNFKTLPHTPAHFKLTAFLSKQAATLEQIVARTGVKERQAVDFINACKLCGYLRVEAPQASIGSSEPRSGNLMSRIRSRLGIRESVHE